MARIKITQVRSQIDQSKKAKATMQALGLKKINQSVVHTSTPQILGMVARIKHLVKIEEVNE